ncbi:MAG: hypothetical protein RBT45_03420 [Acholeplasmataceae bacterium]|jgi:hypothetical protein|nr:hypothetical protein [Acholeplasmataceae bacterium]
MEKRNTDKIKQEFYSLIDRLPSKQDRELSKDLKDFNDTFKGQDFWHQDLLEGVLLFFAGNLKKRMKLYVNDIIEDYNNSQVNQTRIDAFLKLIAEKYSPDKTFLDRLKNLMGIL